MNMTELLILSGQMSNDKDIIAESRESFNAAAKYLWDELVMEIPDEFFTSYDELYSYVNSEMNVNNDSLGGAERAIRSFEKALSVKDGDKVGIPYENGAEAVMGLLDRGLDKLETEDNNEGVSDIIMSYTHASKAIMDFDEFVEQHNSEISELMGNEDPYAERGVSRSDFI